jgi:hypothetical protein
VSADTFCSYCGTNTNPAFSDHREETCEKNPEHATQSPSEAEHRSECEPEQASSGEAEVFHLPSLLALRKHLAEYFDADGDATVSDEDAKKFEAAFLARLQTSGNYVLEDFIARHGLSTAAGKAIILRVLERLAEQASNQANEGSSNELRASKPDDFLNRLIAEGAAEAHTSETAEALAYVQQVLAVADKLEHSQKKELIWQAARLTFADYELLRDEMIVRIGMRKKSEFDKLVDVERQKQDTQEEKEEAEELAGLITNTEPWAEPVDGAAVLDEVSRLYRRYVIFSNRTDPDLLALWVTGTHCYEDFQVFPRLNVNSPVEECGKSRVLNITGNLSYRALTKTANFTGSVAFRVVESYRPLTIFIEELENFIDDNRDLLGILNAGHEQGAVALRNEKDERDRWKPVPFGCYAPVAFHIIGRPPKTLLSRSLGVSLLRKRPDEHVADFDTLENPAILEELTQLRQKLNRWVRDHREEIKSAKPDTSALANRVRDNWKSLMKIASVAGNGWLERAYAAARIAPRAVPESDQLRLLRDIRNIFHTRRVQGIPSVRLVADLNSQRESGWYRYRNGREPLDERALSDLLGDYDIGPKAFSLSDEDQLALFPKNDGKRTKRKGYRLDWFKEYFDRLLANEPAEEVEVSGDSGML